VECVVAMTRTKMDGGKNTVTGTRRLHRVQCATSDRRRGFRRCVRAASGAKQFKIQLHCTKVRTCTRTVPVKWTILDGDLARRSELQRPRRYAELRPWGSFNAAASQSGWSGSISEWLVWQHLPSCQRPAGPGDVQSPHGGCAVIAAAWEPGRCFLAVGDEDELVDLRLVQPEL
jgi:hypothetical protein